MTDRHAEPVSLSGEGLKVQDFREKSSADIEREIEIILRQIDTSLSEIEERLNLQRTVDPIRHFLASPPGKALLLVAMASFARRKPVLAFALGASYFYYRKRSGRDDALPEIHERSESTQWEKISKPKKPTEDRSGQSPPRGDQEPLRGPRVTGPTVAIEAGREATEDGEYSCRNCGHRTYFERTIIVPACPDCGGETFDKENP